MEILFVLIFLLCVPSFAHADIISGIAALATSLGVSSSTAATAIGVTAAAGAAYGGINAMAGAKDSSANDAAEKAKKEAEQKTLLEISQEDKSTAARRSLLAQPTSGFGPNKNLARSFLTKL